MSNKGDLYINIYQASLCSAIFSNKKINPYIKIKLGSDMKTTPAHMGATVEAKFYHSLIFQRTFEEIINIEMWNMNRFLKNDLIGRAQVELSKIVKNNYYLADWFVMDYKNQESGRIFIEFRFIPEKREYLEKEEKTESIEITPSEELITDISPDHIHPDMITIDAREVKITKDFETESAGDASTLR